jgi:hypothetical protein
MPTPIKTWEYPGSHNRTDKIEYYDGYLLKTFGFETPRSNEISINKVLDHYTCISNSILEPQIIANLIQLEAFNPAKFTEKEEKHWRFWNYLEASSLTELHCEATSPSKEQTFLELSPVHLKDGFYRSSGKIYRNTSRLDNLFFYGPKLVGMSLEDRQQVRQTIYNALPPKAAFSQQDMFPLFDYSKIESMRWEKAAKDHSSGDYIELHSNCLTIGGWSSPRDGGASDTSLERIWSQRFTASPSKFKEAYQIIYTMLEKAIIKD